MPPPKNDVKRYQIKKSIKVKNWVILAYYAGLVNSESDFNENSMEKLNKNNELNKTG